MKLVKNGTVLLAAIGAFTMTSCGGNLTKEQARDWLKDVNVEDAKKAKIDSEDYKWDLSVTGTGMTPGEKEGGTYGGVQFLLAFLVNSSRYTDPNFLANFKDLTGDFNSDNHHGETPGETNFDFINQEIFDAITGVETHTNFSFAVKSNLLHVKFDREYAIPSTAIKFLFDEELAVAKDGFVKEDVITFTNAQIDYQQSSFVNAHGTFSGTISRKTNYQNIN